MSEIIETYSNQMIRSHEAHDANRDGSFEFTYRKAFWTPNNVGYDIVIPQATWLGDQGASDATLYHLSAIYEIEIKGTTTTLVDYRTVWVGTLYKGTYGGTATWAFGYTPAENSALRVPTNFNPATAGACQVSMALSGPNNGTITITYLPSGGDAPGGYVTKIRILGGGRYAG